MNVDTVFFLNLNIKNWRYETCQNNIAESEVELISQPGSFSKLSRIRSYFSLSNKMYDREKAGFIFV